MENCRKERNKRPDSIEMELEISHCSWGGSSSGISSPQSQLLQMYCSSREPEAVQHSPRRKQQRSHLRLRSGFTRSRSHRNTTTGGIQVTGIPALETHFNEIRRVGLRLLSSGTTNRKTISSLSTTRDQWGGSLQLGSSSC